MVHGCERLTGLGLLCSRVMVAAPHLHSGFGSFASSPSWFRLHADRGSALYVVTEGLAMISLP
jgi:hypothetical protein